MGSLGTMAEGKARPILFTQHISRQAQGSAMCIKQENILTRNCKKDFFFKEKKMQGPTYKRH